MLQEEKTRLGFEKENVLRDMQNKFHLLETQLQ